MAIKHSTFSGWHLSGKDAEAFEKQIRNLPPNPLADAALKRGEGMFEEYRRTGRILVKFNKEGKAQ